MPINPDTRIASIDEWSEKNRASLSDTAALFRSFRSAGLTAAEAQASLWKFSDDRPDAPTAGQRKLLR